MIMLMRMATVYQMDVISVTLVMLIMMVSVTI